MRTPRGVNPTEYRAAALYAAFEDAHDGDDLLDDRITRRCLAHMLGMCDLTRSSRPVYDLYTEMVQ